MRALATGRPVTWSVTRPETVFVGRSAWSSGSTPSAATVTSVAAARVSMPVYQLARYEPVLVYWTSYGPAGTLAKVNWPDALVVVVIDGLSDIGVVIGQSRTAAPAIGRPVVTSVT